MPLDLNEVAITEKNKLATDSPFLVALKILLPGTEIPVTIINNNEDVEWDGEHWTAMPFDMEELADSTTTEVSSVTIKISNASLVMGEYLEYYDAYNKAYGYNPIIVYIYVINMAVIALDPYAAPEVEHMFELKEPSVNSEWATFVLGAPSPYNKRAPQNRILKNHCRYVFRDDRCGFVGASETTCSHTLANCREIETGTISSSSAGAFTDSTKSGTDNYVGLVMTDSDGNKFTVTGNDGSDFTVDSTETPALGDYTLSNSKRFGNAPGVGASGFELY